ncbi:DUF6922 domain-containing protein [Psychroflexus planctonicus]
MNLTKNILRNIPNYYFWDLDVSKLDIQKDCHVIISRILMFSDYSNYNKNILFLEDLYCKETIQRVLSNTFERIPDDICQLLAKRYHIRVKSKFNKNVYL